MEIPGKTTSRFFFIMEWKRGWIWIFYNIYIHVRISHIYTHIYIWIVHWLSIHLSIRRDQRIDLPKFEPLKSVRHENPRKSMNILERFGNWQREHGRNWCSPRFGRKEVIPSYLLCTLPYHFGIWSDPRRGALPAMRGRNSMEQPLIPMFHVMSYHIVCNTTVYIYIIILKWLYIHSCSLHTIIYI